MFQFALNIKKYPTVEAPFLSSQSSKHSTSQIINLLIRKPEALLVRK